MRLSLRIVLSLLGLAFCVLDGILAFSITWAVSVAEIDRIAEDLRESAISIVQRRILSVTNGVQQLAARNARGITGTTMYGCCSLTDRDALYIREFSDMRSVHYYSVVSNPNVMLAYSASAAGNLLLVYRSNDSRDIDGTNARQGDGNLRWTLSDQSTGFTQQRYFSNTWKSGEYEVAQTGQCGAGRIRGSPDAAATSQVVGRDECGRAAAELGLGGVETAADSGAPECFTRSSGAGRTAVWNAADTKGSSENDTSRRAVCRAGRWFASRSTFAPNCSHSLPCTTGTFASTSDPAFNESLYSETGVVYNATVRSWYIRAVENAGVAGAGRPTWSTIYLSINSGELVLPSVFAMFAGGSEFVTGVVVLGIGLRFLDGIVEAEVKQVSADSSGWIIDLHPHKAGTLLASSPTGLSTAAPQEHTSTGVIVSVFAVNASYYDPAGALIQSVSRRMLGLCYSGPSAPESAPAQDAWAEVEERGQLSHSGQLVQSKVLRDDYGLRWLVVLSVPEEVFLGDLPAARTFTIVLVVLLTALCAVVAYLTMRHQTGLVQAAIEVTEEIAQQLSRYEVEEGSALLEGEAGAKLPDGLRDALQRLLANLHEYIPYLPDAFLVREDSCNAFVAEPPGLGQEQPTVTMCFTDIQSSTELWERHPQAMHTALQIHNEQVRRVAVANGGYEVKVIGDAFMLAFESAEAGCRFALDVQLALVEAKWPADLLEHPLCTPQCGAASGRVLWSGPRVRVGVNCGAVRVEKNPVTGRCDYFGPAVNVAARVETCLRHGGLTGVTRAVLAELSPEAMERLRRPRAVPLGGRDLKGISGSVEVTVLLRQELAERCAVLSEPTSTSCRSPLTTGRLRRRLETEVMSEGTSCSARSSAVVSLGSRANPLALSPLTRGSSHGTLVREGLSQRTATVASFRAPKEADVRTLGHSLVEMLEVVEMAADVTQGVVAGTMSVQCVVVWNGPRACGDHYSQCLRATDHVRRTRFAVYPTGACTGELLYGNVASGRRKYSTVVGGCVELASLLSEEAEVASEGLLAAATFALYCKTQQRTIRYDEWSVRGGVASDTVCVYSVTAPARGADTWSFTEREVSIECLESMSTAAAPSVSGREVVVGAGVALRLPE